MLLSGAGKEKVSICGEEGKKGNYGELWWRGMETHKGLVVLVFQDYLPGA